MAARHPVARSDYRRLCKFSPTLQLPCSTWQYRFGAVGDDAHYRKELEAHLRQYSIGARREAWRDHTLREGTNRRRTPVQLGYPIRGIGYR